MFAFSCCSRMVEFLPLPFFSFSKARKQSLVFVEISSYTNSEQRVEIICIELNRFSKFISSTRGKNCFQFKCLTNTERKSAELNSYTGGILLCALGTKSLSKRNNIEFEYFSNLFRIFSSLNRATPGRTFILRNVV
jgi:hypothetical protein